METQVQPLPIRGSRADRCPDCALPRRSCICAAAPELYPAVRFLVLRHPVETARATNTARLLSACLPQTRILGWAGRQEPPPGFTSVLESGETAPFLLFPGAPLAAEEAARDARMAGKHPLFILLDGSWRQARKMRSTALWLHGLRTVSLDVGASRSRLRRQHRSGNLSTVEAAQATLLACGEDQAATALHAHFHRFLTAWSVLRPYSAYLAEGSVDA